MHSPELLSERAAEAIHASEVVLVSLVSFWELAIKGRAGKINAQAILDGGPPALLRLGFPLLGITYEHVHATLTLPLHHRDPFDRLLIAQAKTEKLALVTSDATFDRYEVERIW